MMAVAKRFGHTLPIVERLRFAIAASTGQCVELCRIDASQELTSVFRTAKDGVLRHCATRSLLQEAVTYGYLFGTRREEAGNDAKK